MKDEITPNTNKSKTKQYLADVSKQKAVIVDIDGTLAHKCERDILDFEKALDDTLDNAIYDVISGLRKLDYIIIVLTGRGEESRDCTEQWLRNNNVGYDYLIMRCENDMRSDDIVKQEIFFKKIADNFNVMMVIDDRPIVNRMWHSIGLKALQVGNQLIEF